MTTIAFEIFLILSAMVCLLGVFIEKDYKNKNLYFTMTLVLCLLFIGFRIFVK